MQLFAREDFVTRMCRLSGRWAVIGREGDSYDLRSDDTRAVRYLSVRHRPDVGYVMFHAALSLRFPLDKTPSGLFARMLLRNVRLKFCHWNLDLRGSFEASAYLNAQWPTPGMTHEFFGSLCREMAEEVSGFHQELRDRFRGDWSPVAPTESAGPDTPEIRFVGPVRDRLPQPDRSSLLHRPRT